MAVNTWSKHEDVRLIQLFKSGMSYERISSRIGRSKNAVASRVQRLGLDTSDRKPKAKTRIAANAKTFYKTCQWPIGDPRDLENFHFCGAPVTRGSYCDEHYRRAYQVELEEAA